MSSPNENSSSSEIESLIKQLRFSSLPIQRERAAYILANFPDSRVVEALLTAQLSDPNPRVRNAASQSLATILASGIDEEEFSNIKKNTMKSLFDTDVDVEIIRKGMRKKKINWKDSLEITLLFKQIERDRYLKKQQNIKNIINSLIMMPINDQELGRDIAITLTEILRITSDENERLTAISSLSNIITNIQTYTPRFCIAEAFLMIFKACDDSELRIIAFKDLEEILKQRKSLAKLNQYTTDIVKLLTFSYDQKIRQVALNAYPQLVLSKETTIPYLVDIIIGTVRATYEDRLREVALKAIKAIIKADRLTEANVERIIKILKSHQSKNIRFRAIELITQASVHAADWYLDSTIEAIFKSVMNTRNGDICYNALQQIEKFAIYYPSKNADIVFKTIVDIARYSSHPLIALRAFNIFESVVINNPELVSKDFVNNYVECIHIHKELSVVEQILISYSQLTIQRKILPADAKQYLKTVLYFSKDPELQELLINYFREAVLSMQDVLPEKILHKLLEISIKNQHDKGEFMNAIENLDLRKLKGNSDQKKI